MIGRSWFEALYAGSDDPWGFRTRWYEARKRALALACLPRERYRSGYEPGCSNGELTAALAARCERLAASDMMPVAVEHARRRTAALGHVRVDLRTLPGDWPEERFDLIVLSEIGYFLRAADWDAAVARALASLEAGGTLLACHWRGAIDGCELDGDAVHARLATVLQTGARRLVRHVRHEEADFLLDCYSDDPCSVARHEGLS